MNLIVALDFPAPASGLAQMYSDTPYSFILFMGTQLFSASLALSLIMSCSK